MTGTSLVLMPCVSFLGEHQLIDLLPSVREIKHDARQINWFVGHTRVLTHRANRELPHAFEHPRRFNEASSGRGVSERSDERQTCLHLVRIAVLIGEYAAHKHRGAR